MLLFFFSLCVIIPTIHYCRVSVRLRKLPLPPCASSTKPKFALIWGPGKKRERRDKLDENVNNDKGFISLRTARKWKAIGLERSSNGIGGDVRRRRHCAHGAKQRTCEDGNKIPKCAHPEDEVEDEEHILDEFGTTFDSHGLDLRSGKCSVVEKLAACVRRVEALTTGLFETHRHTLHSSRNKATPNCSLPPSTSTPPSLLPRPIAGNFLCDPSKSSISFIFFPTQGSVLLAYRQIATDKVVKFGVTKLTIWGVGDRWTFLKSSATLLQNILVLLCRGRSSLRPLSSKTVSIVQYILDSGLVIWRFPQWQQWQK